MYSNSILVFVVHSPAMHRDTAHCAPFEVLWRVDWWGVLLPPLEISCGMPYMRRLASLCFCNCSPLRLFSFHFMCLCFFPPFIRLVFICMLKSLRHTSTRTLKCPFHFRSSLLLCQRTPSLMTHLHSLQSYINSHFVYSCHIVSCLDIVSQSSKLHTVMKIQFFFSVLCHASPSSSRFKPPCADAFAQRWHDEL